MSDWNSKQYLKFEKERTQPAIDLVNRINIDTANKIVDIGCGPGNSTKILSDKFKKAYILGIDSSENMISSAKNSYPYIDWKICDASKELGSLDKDFDVVFSNACIQWIPNHAELLKNMMGLLKKDGVLAVQIPNNFDEPIHQIIQEVSNSEKWRDIFNNPRTFYTLKPNEYFDILSEYTDELSIWETIYYHELASHEDIIEWYRGTGLRPYLSLLNEDKKVEFEQDIMKKLKESYKPQKNNHIIFKFPRLFFIAKSK